MVILRKDRSLDTCLVAIFEPVSPAQGDKMIEAIKGLGGQFHLKKDGSIKYYLPEEKTEGIDRIFILPEKLRNFSKPKIFIEAAEYVEFCKGEKIYVHIISNINGLPLRPFLLSGPKVENEGHAFFLLKKGFAVTAFMKDSHLFVEIVELTLAVRENGQYALKEKVIHECSAGDPRLPYNIRNLGRAIRAVKEKFFCPHCTHAHYYAKN